jgi:hypothetical protein
MGVGNTGYLVATGYTYSIDTVFILVAEGIAAWAYTYAIYANMVDGTSD